jgi:O-succinylbenzoic acid--CoA ligase
MRIENWLTRNAAAFPDRVALIGAGESVTFAELDARSRAAALRLARLGAKPGERVALLPEASLDYAVILHGLMKLGAVAVPLDPRLAEPELERRLDRSRAGLVIRDLGQVAEAGEAELELERSLDLDVVHCVIHTSGTGGQAKPVELTYGNHLWSALGSGARIGIDPADRWLCCLPLHHIGGLAILLRSAVYGTGVVLERFDAEAIRSLIGPERVTLASLVGTTLARLLDAGANLESLRCVLLGGGPVRQDLIDRALDAGVPLAPTYGLTEAASQVTTLPPGEARRRPGSAGTPLLPTEVALDDGAILVRGATVAPGAAGPDGWLRTGDLGRLDEDGHLHVLGRADEVIVSGGEKISPEQVERALTAHPAVVDAGVAGAEDVEWQQAVVAAVVIRDGASLSERELRDFCRRRLAPHEVPKVIRFVKRLPRDEQGKLRREELAGADTLAQR